MAVIRTISEVSRQRRFTELLRMVALMLSTVLPVAAGDQTDGGANGGHRDESRGGTGSGVSSPVSSSEPVQAKGCFLKLKDHADVPALDSGLLTEMLTEVGDIVSAGDALANLDAAEAQLSVRLAEIDLQVAEKTAAESVGVETAETAVREAEKLIRQATVDLQIAEHMAESDVEIRLAEAARKLAVEELTRARASKQQFDASFSDLEMARKQYAVDKSALEIEQAQRDTGVRSLTGDSRRAALEQQQVVVDRRQLELRDAKTNQGISRLTEDRHRQSLEVAREKLRRRRIAAPLSGMVVDQMVQPGEWVTVGDPVLRIIRLDTLLVEGYVEASLADHTDRGRSVTVTAVTRTGTVSVDGSVVFVSPEVDSVNGQIMIRAEIPNPDLLLRPGQRVELTMLPR
ncbi:MAG: HlyD family efflux transporter periplasmic adaptor subunit [Planctomycetaceae bacterium]|nr:HlyD family efflux transporter periplasmic adaptor subunit [Planctomycetaceae bacterium]